MSLGALRRIRGSPDVYLASYGRVRSPSVCVWPLRTGLGLPLMPVWALDRVGGSAMFVQALSVGFGIPLCLSGPSGKVGIPCCGPWGGIRASPMCVQAFGVGEFGVCGL